MAEVNVTLISSGTLPARLAAIVTITHSSANILQEQAETQQANIQALMENIRMLCMSYSFRGEMKLIIAAQSVSLAGEVEALNAEEVEMIEAVCIDIEDAARPLSQKLADKQSWVLSIKASLDAYKE